MTANKRENWMCDFCHKQKDTLYFHGKRQICEECRKKIEDNKNSKPTSNFCPNSTLPVRGF